MGYVYLFRSIAQLSIFPFPANVFVLCSFLTLVLCDHFTWLMTPSVGNCTCGKRSQYAPLHVSPPQQGSTAAKLEKLTRVNMSLTLSCKLVEVFAMIYAVLLQNQAQDSVVLCHQIPHFHSPIESPRYGGPSLYGGLRSSSSGSRSFLQSPHLSHPFNGVLMTLSLWCRGCRGVKLK